MYKIILFFISISFFISCNSNTQENQADGQKTETTTTDHQKTATTKKVATRSSTPPSVPDINISAGQKLTSPLDLKINSKGVWAGQNGQLGRIVLTDEAGNILGEGIMNADGEWKKDGPVDYSTRIQFNAKSGTKGRLKMISQPGAGPGLGENDRYEYEMVVSF